MKDSKKVAKRKPRVRLPLPKKPGHPHGPPQGEKGYDRKKKKKEIEREQESE